ncbi:Nicotinate phosphoribosyltransferase [Monocercomonoides exilis]|uniref:Nicotinate phosphoribosyltransferase n=1 Tax=Monocercomonoides exilis TaxID=2049356 RepID=UPI0035597517|nr:Nicotinate phosphoribosyltransferase [Monocercomonoides exilis]|eukprot:MONOS_10132.1-p1 / transcript=MONOS_10132.1 / gene=MONOS_10132 / organism=Monocercomonoides_exilis_PA203 / gene_product=Nicotinate phosphoribosyltransferase / transcript_product=Nicotinate phosphoribosyltransferase / location=Mono_scaffold00447:19683-21919(-) / protein_length=574 / sequence_SO=supercontig / SO=protein_coding / is_pseudo=false
MSDCSLTPADPGFSVSSFLQTPFLTDMYQLTMCYAYWRGGIHNKKAAFELFFRKCPFKGEYAIFAGLDTVLRFLEKFHFSDSDIEYLKTIIPHAEPEFFEYVKGIDGSCLKVYSLREGTMCFPSVPLLRVEGPLAVAQLVETTLLNIIGFPTLVATNAARMRHVAGPEKTLLEFGLRRAQGPDGGMSASVYAIMGGFDKTSNVLAGKLFGLELSGTHAHAFVMSYQNMKDVKNRKLRRNIKKEIASSSSSSSSSSCPSLEESISSEAEEVDFVELVLSIKSRLGIDGTQEGELAAFTAYAISFPNGFCALVDTYNTLKSGVPNFICVSVALVECGYEPGSVRLDSGDLAYLSIKSKEMFREYAEKANCEKLKEAQVVASNDINETTIVALNEQHHQIDVFGIGTNLVTCQGQPSLGCVYKLVELEGSPRIKLSDEMGKTTLPSRKVAFRLHSSDDRPLLDILVRVEADDTFKAPQSGEKVLCRHPFVESKRCYVIPERVEQLHSCVWDGRCLMEKRYSCVEIRDYVNAQMNAQREDRLRIINPTPYKVSLTQDLFEHTHELMMECMPIPVLEM